MENQTKTPCGASDLRVFVIALLTALIVIALYHFGTGYCRMMFRAKACPPGVAPAKVFVVGGMPCGDCRGCDMRQGGHGHRHMMREGVRPMPQHGHHKHRHDKAPARKAPAPAPAPVSEAPAAPAPAPAV